ncbi:MAG: hypothetical protein GON13_00155 [Nanoarchaeota archaeon]|nr:hypothetical protein [Nanoarchaeota archaeon]
MNYRELNVNNVPYFIKGKGKNEEKETLDELNTLTNTSNSTIITDEAGINLETKGLKEILLPKDTEKLKAALTDLESF